MRTICVCVTKIDDVCVRQLSVDGWLYIFGVSGDFWNCEKKINTLVVCIRYVVNKSRVRGDRKKTHVEDLTVRNYNRLFFTPVLHRINY